MADKLWTSQADWETWAAENADTTTSPGDVLVAVGEAMATITSPVYEAAGWTAGAWVKFTLEGVRPTAANYIFRFRVGATAGACALASWSTWEDAHNVDDNILFDLETYCLNDAAFNVGPWIQFQVRIRRA